MVYSDIPNEFITHPTSGELVLKNDELAVRQSLRNLINLEMSDKPFHPEKTLNFKRILFEQLTPFLVNTVKRNMINMIGSLEPRAEIIDINIGSYEDSGAIIVSVIYRIINNQKNQTIDFFFDRIR